jgi:hypothetical protein
VFNTQVLAALLKDRVMGSMNAAFSHDPDGIGHLSQMTPGRLLIAPGLWIGLIFTALFLAAAIRLRRNREPI